MIFLKSKEYERAFLGIGRPGVELGDEYIGQS